MESRLEFLSARGKNKHGQTIGLFRCVCGTEKVLEVSRVKTGRVRSCGCLKRDSTEGRWQTYRGLAFPARLKATPSGCLEWQGPVDQTGYGYIGYAGKVWRSHRLAWHLANGPIPEGQFVLHACDNKRCCNPAPGHLYLGDHTQNMRDVVERGNRKGVNAGAKNGRSKLSQAKANHIRVLYATGKWSQEKLGQRYGVSQWAVSAIVRGKRYI